MDNGIILQFSLCLGYYRLIVGPTDIVANIGDTAKFFCESTTSPVIWKFQEEKALHSNMIPFFTENRNIYGLQIIDVKKQDAGKYWCYIDYDNLISVDVGTLRIQGVLM